MFYTNVSQMGNKFLHRFIDDDGQKHSRFIHHDPSVFISSKVESEFKGVKGEYLHKMDFDTVKEAKDYVSMYKSLFPIHGQLQWRLNCIQKLYPNDINYDFNKLVIATLDIENLIGDNGFTNPDVAPEPITAITVGVNGKKYTAFSCVDYVVEDDDVTHIKCTNEVDLLVKFLDFWKRLEPDILSGWNCIPLNSNIFLENEIKEISDLSIGDNLIDSSVVDKFPVSNKELYNIELSNGFIIESSKDHIFPITHINGEKYTRLTHHSRNKDILKLNDYSVENIPLHDSCFVEIKMGNNVNIDYDIPDNILYTLGFIYADGSLKNKESISNGFTLYQSDHELLESFDYLTTKISGTREKGYSRFHKYSLIGENYKFIYDVDLKKRLNVNLLSKLSYRQFMIFLSGCLDGDGFITSNSISLCNFNNDINSLYTLCVFNGIFSTLNSDNTHIRFVDLKFDDLSLRKYKRWGNFKPYTLDRKSSNKAKHIKYKKHNNSYYVKIKNIVNTGQYCDMIDIETDTHYFQYNGVNTHNCAGYDVPYMINRIRKVLGEKFIGLLAPTAYKHNKKYAVSSRESNDGVIWSLSGISIMDYMLMYKKFTFKTRERYSLDYIAYVELGDKKIDYSEHGNLDDLYRSDPQKYVSYNIKDVKLIDRLDDKLNMFLLTTSLAYMTHINFDDVFSQVRLWDQFIYCEMMKDNIVVQPKKEFSKSEKYEGAVVFEPKTGMYDWILSFDLDGLYPHIMMQNNISIEKLVEFHDIEEDELFCEYWDDQSGKLEMGLSINDYVNKKDIPIKDSLIKNNLALSVNGSMYKKDGDGIIPIMLKQLYIKRKVFKTAMLEAEQNVVDIQTERNSRNKSL